MKSKFVTDILSESEYDAWEDFVTDSPQGSIYSRPSYLDVLCSAAGGSFSIIACKKGNEIVGGVGLYQTDGKFGKQVSTRLLLYYNGLVLKSHNSKYPSVRSSRDLAILAAIIEQLDSMDFSKATLHCRGGFQDARPFLESGWKVRPSYSYQVDIRDFDATLERVEQNQRRLVNRCADAGMRLVQDDDFDSFYRMHEATHRRKGAPLYLPRDAFASYFSRLSEMGMCRLFQVRDEEGKSVATQLTLTCKHPVSHTVCAAADEESLKSGTTPFLRVKVFEELSGIGYEANDLTDAALNPVTRFKSQLGGDLKLNLVLTRAYSDKIATHDWLRDAGSQVKNVVKGIIRR